MNNRIYCPVANGWAERINKSKKMHVCRQCKRNIAKGSSYVSLHVSLGGCSWVSEALCDDCYTIAFEREFGFTPPVKALPEGVEAVYRTSDGEVFSTINDAERHIQIQKGKEYCLMYDGCGERTSKVEECIVLKILSGDGMRYFVDACKRYMAEHPDNQDISGGLAKDYDEYPDLYEHVHLLYLWEDTEYILIDDNQIQALKGYLQFINKS